MSNFVDDLTSLPDGKTDAPTSVSLPAGQKVTAAEWNTAMQAAVDLRGALLAGKVHGLESNPAAAVGSATQAILRSNNGALEVSESGAGFKGVSAVFNVKAYGAKGDGTTNDAAAIQAALTAAAVSGGTVFVPAGTYKVNTELTAASGVRVIGDGLDVSILRAGAAIASVLAVNTSGKTKVSELTLDGNSYATSAMRANGGCALASFDRVKFTGALRDGLYFDGTGIQDTNFFRECVFYKNGTMYRTAGRGSMAQYTNVEVVAAGTVATASGVAVVGTGTAFLSMGIRRGDFIAVGVSPLTEYLQIASVTDDTHLVLETSSTLTRSGQDFVIGVGDGYHETYGAADNNVNTIQGGHAYQNAGTALVIGGLYGARVHGVQIDYQNGYAVAVGVNTIAPVYSPLFDGLYIESCNAGGFFLGYTQGVTISGTMDSTLGAPLYHGQVTSAAPPRWRAINSSLVSGAWIGSTGFSYAGGAVDPIGSGVSNMPVSVTVPSGSRFTVAGRASLAAELAGAVAGTTISPGTTHSYLSLAGNVTMTATPTLGTSGRSYGDLVLLYNAEGGFNLTLQDDSFVSNTKLKLAGHQQLVIPHLGVAMFVFEYDGMWHLVGTDGALTDAADSTGSSGNATQNTLSGRVAIAAGAAAVTVTNSKVTSTSKVFAQLQTADGTLTFIKSVVPGAGSFVVTGNASATGNTDVAWHLVT